MTSKARINVKVTDKGVKDVAKKLFGKGTASVTVGVFDTRAGEPVKSREGQSAAARLTVGELAAIHEFGTPNNRPPQRSFVRSYFDSELPQILDAMRKVMGAIIAQAVKSGVPLTDADRHRALERLGVYMKGRMQSRFAERAIQPAALAESTIERKGSSVALIDTGQLRSSIHYKTEIKG